jgi:NADPH:quinone reductase-like Zn-dependent oxidoreductase
MRAAYHETFGGPENLQVGDRAAPVPNAGQMLVRIVAAGVGIWDVGMMGNTIGARVVAVASARHHDD